MCAILYKKDGAEPIRKGESQLFCEKLHYDIMTSTLFVPLGVGVFKVGSLDTRQ